MNNIILDLKTNPFFLGSNRLGEVRLSGLQGLEVTGQESDFDINFLGGGG